MLQVTDTKKKNYDNNNNNPYIFRPNISKNVRKRSIFKKKKKMNVDGRCFFGGS